MFITPKWDVEYSSEKLNVQLFGDVSTKRNKKINNKKTKTEVTITKTSNERSHKMNSEVATNNKFNNGTNFKQKIQKRRSSTGIKNTSKFSTRNEKVSQPLIGNEPATKNFQPNVHQKNEKQKHSVSSDINLLQAKRKKQKVFSNKNEQQLQSETSNNLNKFGNVKRKFKKKKLLLGISQPSKEHQGINIRGSENKHIGELKGKKKRKHVESEKLNNSEHVNNEEPKRKKRKKIVSSENRTSINLSQVGTNIEEILSSKTLLKKRKRNRKKKQMLLSKNDDLSTVGPNSGEKDSTYFKVTGTLGTNKKKRKKLKTVATVKTNILLENSKSENGTSANIAHMDKKVLGLKSSLKKRNRKKKQKFLTEGDRLLSKPKNDEKDNIGIKDTEETDKIRKQKKRKKPKIVQTVQTQNLLNSKDTEQTDKKRKKKKRKKPKFVQTVQTENLLNSTKSELVTNANTLGDKPQIKKSPFNINKLKEIFGTKPLPSLSEEPQIAKPRGQRLKETKTLRERMMKKLSASRFRYLNEQLYTSGGKDAKLYFQSDPDAFQAYHAGYQQQVRQWPVNPLDIIIKSIRKMSSELVVADFGCGDARLSQSVSNNVHSFDLVAVSEDVTACDMAHTPLASASVDIVVFCLSLMGSNLRAYFTEANRVLKDGGLMKIAEVESRFENIESFIQTMQKFGFVNTWKDLSHNLFYFMDFKKERTISKKMKTRLREISLKPCLYKKR